MQLTRRKYLVTLVFNLEYTTSNFKWIVPELAETHDLIGLRELVYYRQVCVHSYLCPHSLYQGLNSKPRIL